MTARPSGEHGFVPVKRSAEHGFTPARRSAEHGFTLVELMVALFVFGLIAAAGVALLGFSVRAQAAAGERLDQSGALRRMGAIMTADLAQAAPRLGRDRDGNALPAFAGGADSVQFVRRGWSNSGGAARGTLQRVEYRLEGDRLVRRAWPMVDGAEPSDPTLLIAGARSVAIRYRSDEDWRAIWNPTRPTAMPRAVELTVDLGREGQVRQLFIAGTGQ